MVVSVENKASGSVPVIGQSLMISPLSSDVMFILVMVSPVNVPASIDAMLPPLIVSLLKVSPLNTEAGKVVLGQLIMVTSTTLGKSENALEPNAKEEIPDLHAIVIEFGCLVLNPVVLENAEN